MIIKNNYFLQVKELVSNNANLDENDFTLLYEVLQGNEGKINPGFLADKLVKELFGGMHAPLIPWDFLETEVGKALIKVKFNYGNDILLVNDVARIVGCSKQYILKECSNENLKGEKRDGTWIIREKDLNEYLVKKGKPSLYEKREVTYATLREEILSDDKKDVTYTTD